ncbi:MAG: chromosomal replication initiator protein DnaA [Prevotella sp.]|nr:chromosomal replication initiator protein DnaA [Candidatus Equicola faecalis]
MIENAKQRWANCLEYIKANVSASQYDTWFASLSFVKYLPDSNTLFLLAPNSLVRDYIEENYVGLLHKVLVHFYGKGIRLNYCEAKRVEDANMDAQEESSLHKHPQSSTAPFKTYLDRTRTFDNFVSGQSNHLPFTVAKSMTEDNRSTLFNPFFVFGPSGCGKTHLINAIGLQMLAESPMKRILYVSARIFQVQYVEATLKNTRNDFIHFYQSIDVLIIDDVQEWMTSVKTQEVFFHIFDHLLRNGKRIILASDRPPVDLKGMIDRLLTRLKCGLLAEIEKPDPQLCRDILRFKAAESSISIPNDVIDYIANVAGDSVRNLEGIINSMKAHLLVRGAEIDLSLARSLVKAIVRTEPKGSSLESIVNCVCTHFNVSHTDIAGKCRRQNLVQARQVSMYLASKLTPLSKSQIGRRIADRDHTTVLHSCAKVEAMMKEDAVFAEMVRKMEKELAF